MQESQKTQEPGRQRGGRGARGNSNPLANSPLFSSDQPVAELPELPANDTARDTPPPVQRPAAFGGEQKPALLYNSPVPPDFILRPFEQQHDRQTIYIDARKAGALDAIVKLVTKGNKTDLVAEMVDDIIEKYAQVLQQNEELVRLTEEKYRKKHNL